MENFTWEDVFVDIPGEYFFEGKKEYILCIISANGLFAIEKDISTVILPVSAK